MVSSGMWDGKESRKSDKRKDKRKESKIMNKKDISEIKKRYTPDRQNFTRIAGAYVNSEKTIVSTFVQTPFSMDEEEFGRYLDIAKKSLSGRSGNNLLCLPFINDGSSNEIVDDLDALRTSDLKDKDALDRLYQLIIDNYTCETNFLIIVFADTYDVPVKAKDGTDLDESSDVFQYILVSICPVKRTKPSLGFREDEERIGEILPVWSASSVDTAVMYPAFADRYADCDHVLTYSKTPAAPHNEFFVDGLGLDKKLSTTQKKETFQNLVEESVMSKSGDDAEETKFNIADGLYNYIEKQKALNGDSEGDTAITADDIKDIMTDAGVPEDQAENAAKSFRKEFSEVKNAPSAEELIDDKALKLSDLYHKKQALQREVARLNGVERDREKADNRKCYIDIPADIKSSVFKLEKDGKDYVAVPASVDIIVNGEAITD